MASPTRVLKLGTRGSPLALAQAREVRARLVEAHGLAAEAIEIVPIRTSGDAIQDRALSEAGGKGLFTKELDRALIDGGIDLAVHSAKDLPTVLPEAIEIAGYLPREDARDVFLSPRFTHLEDLPAGAVVGSASLRRQALARRLRPDLEIRLLRGNVQTRLAKLDSGEFDATILAMAGLKRLGLTGRVTAILAVEEFLPAVGQGAIAITVRREDAPVLAAIVPILDADTGLAVSCERAFLGVLDGSCRTPIAGHAHRLGDALEFRGLLLGPDGSEAVETLARSSTDNAVRLGEDAGHDLLSRASGALLAQIRAAP
ncbi:MAG TPA: hydroxymethylbilane synthase [Lichenihabitans sp.]|nr:hydroxymethylbilane synthase [Lichenihabitans sp.]